MDVDIKANAEISVASLLPQVCMSRAARPLHDRAWTTVSKLYTCRLRYPLFFSSSSAIGVF